MSKQTQANAIYAAHANVNATRKSLINIISNELGVSVAYASTLYNEAKKAAGDAAPAARTPKTETVSALADKITRIDRPTVRMLRHELESTLKEFGSKYGLTIDVGSIRFSDEDFTTKVKVSCGSSGDAAKREFERYAWKFGLKKDDYGRDFTHGGTRFTVVGIKPRSRRYPIIGVNGNGTRYKFPASVLK